MRTSKVIQLVCWSLVAVLLLGILVFSIVRYANGRRLFEFPRVNFGNWGSVNITDDGNSEEGSGRYSVDGSYSVPAEGIKNIDISWISGEVNIVPCDGDEILISETARRTLDPEEKLIYDVRGDTLAIKVWEDHIGFVFGRFNISKNLTVQVPAKLAAELGDLRVNAVSADLRSDGLKAGYASLETVSGGIRFENFDAEELKANTTSGDIELDGSYSDIDANSVSGSIGISDSECPKKVNIGTVSGDAKIYIPDNGGFTVKYEKVSGDFECEFPITTAKNGGTYKEGGATFRMSTVSGDLDLKKLSK
jgi:hypothetical protein